MTQDAEDSSTTVIRRLVRHCPTALRELVLRNTPPRWRQRELAGRRADRVGGDDLLRVASGARRFPGFESELLRLLEERNPFFLAPLELLTSLPTKVAADVLSWLGWWAQPRASDLTFLAQTLLDEALPDGLQWADAGDDRVLVSGASPREFLDRAERAPLVLVVDASRVWAPPIVSLPEAREALDAEDYGRAMEALLSHEDSYVRTAGVHLAAWSGDGVLVDRALERLTGLPSAAAACHVLAVARALARQERDELEALVAQSRPLPDALRAIGLDAVGRGDEAVRLLVREQRDHDWLGVSSLALACAMLERHEVQPPASAVFLARRGWASGGERAAARAAIDAHASIDGLRRHTPPVQCSRGQEDAIATRPENPQTPPITSGNPLEAAPGRDAGLVPTPAPDDVIAPSVEVLRRLPDAPGPPCQRVEVVRLRMAARELATRHADVVGALALLTGKEGEPEGLCVAVRELSAAQRDLRRSLSGYARCAPDCAGRQSACTPVRTVAADPALQLADVTRVEAELLRLETALETAIDEIARITASSVEAAAELGDPEPPAVEPRSLLEAIQQRSDAVRRRDDLTERRATEMHRARRVAEEALSDLEALATTEARRTAIAGLRDGLRDAPGLAALRDVRRRAESARAEWVRRPITAVAESALRAGMPAMPEIVELAEALRESQAPLAALVLLWIVQRTEPVDALLSTDVRAFWALWLQLVAESATSNERRAVCAHLAHESWLLDVSETDLPEEAPAALGLLLVAWSRSVEALAATAARLHTVSRLESLSAVALARAATSIERGVSLEVVDDDPTVALARARTSVEDLIQQAFSKILSKTFGQAAVRERVNAIREALREAWRLELTGDDGERARATRRVEAAIDALDHTFFRREAQEDVKAIQVAVGGYRSLRERSANAVTTIARADLERDAASLAGQAGEHRALVDLALQSLGAALPTGHWPTLLVGDAELAHRMPGLVARIAADVDWVASRRDLDEILRDLSEPPRQERARMRLEEASCYDALDVLVRSDGTAADRRGLRQDALRVRARTLAAEMEPALRSRVEGALERRCWRVVEQALDDFESVRAESERRGREEVTVALKALRAAARAVRDEVDERPVEQEWRERFGTLIDAILRAIAGAMHPERAVSEKVSIIPRIARATEVARDVLRLDARNLDALEAAVGDLEQGSRPVPEPVQSGELDFSRTEGKRLAVREDSWQRYRAFADAVSPDSVARGRQLLLSFCRLVDLYGDEQDQGDRFVLRALPGSDYYVVDTGFHKPGGRHFEAPVRLHLIPSRKRQAEEVSVLTAQIEDRGETPRHHVVIVGGDASAVRSRLLSSSRSERVTVVAAPDLKRMAEARAPGAPLRHAMRRAVSVETTSPFKSEGYVSQERHIYVRRAGVAERLVDGRSWALWGGRRSGKTSLLHEVLSRLTARRAPGTVVYVSFESLARTPIDQIDDAAAALVARTLRWESTILTVDDLARRLADECHAQPVTLLIDEADAYVKAHVDAARTDYRLFRALRGLANQHQARLACVVAGFKYLFRVMKMDRFPDDPSYPWQNWLDVVPPLARLTADETREMLREGFEDLLGLSFEPQVPLLVHKYTGGHPASVQQFANCILRDIADSVRADVGRVVTEGDVRRTFEATVERDGREPFIRFFESTLDMNLAALERIIVYVMAALLIGRSGDATAWFARHAIEREVSYFFDGGAHAPSQRDFQLAFHYLEMTGMLELQGHQVRMAFPWYADILVRLEEANRDRIATLTRDYLAADR